MQVYSKTDARKNFSSLFNTVFYGGNVVGVGRGKVKVKGHILPEVLMVKMPSPKDIEDFKNSPLGFDEVMKKWILEKIAKEFDQERYCEQ